MSISIGAMASLVIAFSGAKGFDSEVRIRYAAWDAAYLRHDIGTLESIMHSRFRIVTDSQKVIKRADYLKSLRKGKPPVEYKTTVLRTETKGTKGYAWTKEISRSADSDAHHHTYRDTWTKVKGHWRILESKTLSKE